VIGQPLFAEPVVGLFGRLTDITLPNYDQYAALACLIARSQHAIVVLTGDVHYGRVASSLLDSGAPLVEVISSPLALVNCFSRSDWQAAPDAWPATAVAGVGKRPVQTEQYLNVDYNHFATVHFAALGARVRMRVQFWRTATNSCGAVPGANPLASNDYFLF